MELDQAEARYQMEAQPILDAERLYDRRWALDLLDHALVRLRREFESSGKAALFQALRNGLLEEGLKGTYAEIGAHLGMSETGVKVAIHRLRQRYRELLRDEIAQTVSRPEEVGEEMHYLFEVVNR